MKTALFIFSLLITTFNSQKLYAQVDVDPRLKAVGTMALYGTAGGFLLGIASLAFDTRGRNVAQGTSLGLYAGLIFGGYVVSAHYMQRYRELNPEPDDLYYHPDGESLYESEQRWNPSLELNWELQGQGQKNSLSQNFSKPQRALFYLDLIEFYF